MTETDQPFAETDRIADLALDDDGLPPPTPEIDQERRVAVFELLEGNRFALTDPAAVGPYAVTLGLAERRLRVAARPAGAAEIVFEAPLGAVRPLISDYFAVCDSYYDAVRRLPPSQIEALDQHRRELHGEGAEALRKRMAEHARMDVETARRLFTLVCALVGSEGGSG